MLLRRREFVALTTATVAGIGTSCAATGLVACGTACGAGAETGTAAYFQTAVDRAEGVTLIDGCPRLMSWHMVVRPRRDKDLARYFERGRPLGSDPWTLKMAGRMGLQYTLNPRGRPKMQGGEK